MSSRFGKSAPALPVFTVATPSAAAAEAAPRTPAGGGDGAAPKPQTSARRFSMPTRDQRFSPDSAPSPYVAAAAAPAPSPYVRAPPAGALHARVDVESAASCSVLVCGLASSDVREVLRLLGVRAMGKTDYLFVSPNRLFVRFGSMPEAEEALLQLHRNGTMPLALPAVEPRSQVSCLSLSNRAVVSLVAGSLAERLGLARAPEFAFADQSANEHRSAGRAFDDQPVLRPRAASNRQSLCTRIMQHLFS